MIPEAQFPGRIAGGLHVAVLECERMPPDIIQKQGNFGDIFNTWLQSGIGKLNSKREVFQRLDIVVSRWPVLDGVYPGDISKVDAFIITGSSHGAYDNLPWIRNLETYIQDVYAQVPRIKFFGGCFGHQIIAKALLSRYGAIVERSEAGWENGVHKVTHSAQFLSHFPLLKGQEMRYQFVHSDQVVYDSLPDDWLCIGSSDMCQVQGLYSPGRVLTYQGHPEFDRSILHYFMNMLASSGSIDTEVYETSLKLLDQESTSLLAAEVVLRFLESRNRCRDG